MLTPAQRNLIAAIADDTLTHIGHNAKECDVDPFPSWELAMTRWRERWVWRVVAVVALGMIATILITTLMP